MQDQTDRPLVLIQCIATQWTEATHDEHGVSLRKSLPEMVDFPSPPPDLLEHENDQMIDILYQSVLYEEHNSYRRPTQQSWVAHHTLLPDEAFDYKRWGQQNPPPASLTMFYLPTIPGQRAPRLRMDVISRNTSLEISLWRILPDSDARQSRYPGLKRREFLLHPLEWALLGEGSRSLSWNKPVAYLSYVLNIGHVRSFTPTLFRDSAPVFRWPAFTDW